MSDQQARFYERHGWQATVAVVVLVGALWALIGAPTPWKLITNIVEENLPNSNTMLVLDSSRAMAQQFTPKTTKMDAALEAVELFTLPLKNEGLALRTFGGSCKDPGRRLVDFEAEHGDDVRDASADLRPQGRSNLAGAVRAAIDDFADDRFPDNAKRRIVVFTGSVDQCTGAAAARDIRDDIKRSGVHATFKFVGLKLGNKSRERLLTFEKALGQRAADIAFATTTSDLAAVKGWLRQDTGRTSDCADEVDNDGDGEVDDEDPQCASGGTQEAARRSGECADQTDNDGDGKVDDEDPQCASGGTQEAARRSGRLPRR